MFTLVGFPFWVWTGGEFVPPPLIEGFTMVLSIGPAHTMTQNIVYALPAVQVRLQAEDPIEVSLDNDTWAVLAGSTTGALTSAVFARCTTGNTIVVVKRA